MSPQAGAEGGRGLIVAAPASGSGKTLVTLGVLRALSRRGVAVRGAKSGPDYIDPRFHEAACGVPCPNLDAWAMAPERLRALATGPGLLIVEGAMGLFDGAPPRARGKDLPVPDAGDGAPFLARGATGSPPGGRGSTAELARALHLPVVLVVDASRMAQSVAPLVAGFAAHDPEVRIAGVILNRVGSDRHAALLRDALHGGPPVLGALRRDARLAHPSRHLGLVPAGERADLGAFLDAAADAVEAGVDLPALLALAAPLPPAGEDRLPPRPGAGRSPLWPGAGHPPLRTYADRAQPPAGADRPAPPAGTVHRHPPPAQRIAVARDRAFGFAYIHILDDWRAGGAEILPFSPLADEAPDAQAGFVWLPGGFPELHAGRLAGAARFRAGMVCAATQAEIWGECGGYMVLGDGLVDAEGTRHAMLGLLRLETSFAARRLHLGYRHVTGLAGAFAGRHFAAHEFHYATTLREAGAPAFRAVAADGTDLGPTGLARGRVTGSFLHLIEPVPSAPPEV